jgi:Mg2+ and Co2+ transporter CorA
MGRAKVGARRLLWVDIDLDAGGSLDVVADRLALRDGDRRRIEADTGRARMVVGTDRLHLTLEAIQAEESDAGDGTLARRELDLIAIPNVVVSVHRGPIDAVESFIENLERDTSLGVLGAADLLSSLVDECIAGYYVVAERIEKDIDRLDQRALRGHPTDAILEQIVAMRGRIAFVRRTLAPHRAALAALARPEMQAEGSVGQPWPALTDRLEGAMSSVEALRDALLGTYDIYMGRAAQRSNDVMKALTLVSAVFLPAVVTAGIMGMNFKLPFFDDPINFYLVVGAMIVFAVSLLVAARWRHWI